MTLVPVLLGLLVVGGSASGRSIQEEVTQQTWVEIRTGNFQLYSCAPTQTVLAVARRLEQFRTAYGELAGWQAVATPPIVVMVYPDTRSRWAFGHLDEQTREPATD